MGVRNIAVTITGDASSLQGALLRSAGEVDGFAKKVETSNGRMGLSWKTAGLAAKAGVAVVAVSLTAAAVAAAQFETRMRNVNSLVHLNDQQFSAMSKSVLDLSTKLPQSANTLAEGLYDITSSGFAGSDALLVLQKSAEAASAGLTTTANAAQAIDAVLNAYGLSAASAGDVSDTLFQTVNLGVVSFEELSGVIGDVVGTAAAASVPIADVGAAIATMTLSGISASEAGTSLNRVLQSLIQPSDGLASVYKSLGIESGAAELKTKGLQGVMDELRTATGGNITTLLQLFPEIRAARGALSLMSNEGKTYARVSAGITDENARQGATHKALAEQMKATSYQLKIIKNDATAVAIAVGTQLLPPFQAFLEALHTAGSEAAPLLAKGISAVTPLFESLYKTGQNVVGIFAELLKQLGPLVAGFLAVAGSVVVSALTTLAKLLEAITGFAKDHETAVLALATAYGIALLPSLVEVAAAFGAVAFESVVLGLNAVLGAAGAASVGIRGLVASMLTLQGVGLLGVAAAALIYVNGMNGIKKAQAEAAAEVDRTTASFDAFDTTKAQAMIDDLRGKAELSARVGAKFQGVWGQALLGLDAALPETIAGIDTGAGSFKKLAEQGQAAADKMAELQEKLLNTNANVVKLSADTGLSVQAIEKLARTNKIDLTNPYFSEESTAARRQVLQLLKDIEKQAGVSGNALTTASDGDIDALQALAKALDDVQQKVAGAFSKDTDVLGTFNPQAAADAAKSAAQGVAQAEDALAKARKGTDPDALKNAERGLTEARRQQAKTAAEQPTTLAASYAKSLSLARSFSTDIQRAQAAGLDPGAVTRLLELGPARAEPILQQLVADHSGRLIKMVNDSEAALARISTQVLLQSRLLTIATNAATDAPAKNLTEAMRIASEAFTEGDKATYQSVAKALGVPSARVRAIAQMFGITLRDEVQKGLDKKPLKPPTVGGVVASTPAGRDKRYATGGMIYGPGGPTDDRVPILASPSEFRTTPAALKGRHLS
jgi:TP901 family phage tail tape measure protein